MTAKPEPWRMTVAESHAHERTATYKCDFIDGRLYPVQDPYRHGNPQAMAGVSREHSRIKENLIGELFVQLKACGCQTEASDQRVRMSPTDRYNCPDVVIGCEPPQYAASGREARSNAPAGIEVLSRSMEPYERGPKFADDRQPSTIREVVFVAMTRPGSSGSSASRTGPGA